MDNDILTKRNERVKKFFALLDKILDRIEIVLTSNKPSLFGERFLTDIEMAKKLKISRRTLQLYRTEGKIPYFQFGGKMLYRESDIQKILDRNYVQELK
ncbi:MAG: helix-turn-helix domain-containing protein [Dysgonomonas mossii]|nr:helix-turn-helix domain-containing protein [Dysgonomonas mossii]